MTCRVCQSETDVRGLLHRCSNNTCRAVYWDKFAVKRLLKENKEKSNEVSPDWVQTVLREAEVPESVAGEYYVYIIKLRKKSSKKHFHSKERKNAQFWQWALLCRHDGSPSI